MSTHLQIGCPSCQKTLKIRPAYLGHRVACKYCEHQFVPTADVPEAGPESSGDVPSLEELWERETRASEGPPRPRGARRPDEATAPPAGPPRHAGPDQDDSSALIPVRREDDEPRPEVPFEIEAARAPSEADDLRGELERLRAENAWLRDEVESLRRELDLSRDRDGSAHDLPRWP